MMHGLPKGPTRPTSSLTAASDELDESLIRKIFQKNKKSELFVTQTPELLKAAEAYQEEHQQKEDRRRTRFVALLAKAGNVYSNITPIDYKEAGKKGFPAEYRHQVYEHLLDLAGFEAKYGKDYFVNSLKADIPSSIGRVIQADIPRTLSSFVSTCGDVTKATLMKMLRDVLWAFAVHKPEIGYCQSMNFIAAYFISVLGSAKKSFYALVQLIDSPTSPYIGLHIPGYYAPGMRQLLTDISILEMMCRKRMGDKTYVEFFEKREIGHLSMIVSEWFLTAFITVFPIRTVQRVMDYIISCAGGSSKVLFRIAFVLIRDLVGRRHELLDLDQVMQGHKRITKQWVRHNELIVNATRGVRLFSKKDLDRWRAQVSSRSSANGSLLSHPVGSTMMRLEDAIAPTTVTTLSMPEEGLWSVPEEASTKQ